MTNYTFIDDLTQTVPVLEIFYSFTVYLFRVIVTGRLFHSLQLKYVWSVYVTEIKGTLYTKKSIKDEHSPSNARSARSHPYNGRSFGKALVFFQLVYAWKAK